MSHVRMVFEERLKTYTVPQDGSPSPRPWTFKHSPQVGAIENHVIIDAEGGFVGEVYTLADAKLICGENAQEESDDENDTES